MKRVLIVDDEADVNLLFKIILEENNQLMVHSYTDAITALRNFRSGFYDLVLLDIKMPKMNGFELYKEISRIDPKVKVCFLTASEKYYEAFRREEEEINAILGENYFIQKPIENMKFIKTIMNII
ncbi:MAG TPA: response regulator [Nitrososphaeraceae archaeon]|nr:response regulator [Nitrososphaeraceae archaeon]